ncbi:hypothetical protein B0I37DRAFT_446434 [Chaetomium sp. MPI-CAGE-AT-0009]|nr:hypothetical protein B0I37DRAFT_446434 [Chaetomium sp. MPI-CAGE-AT-0009]
MRCHPPNRTPTKAATQDGLLTSLHLLPHPPPTTTATATATKTPPPHKTHLPPPLQIQTHNLTTATNFNTNTPITTTGASPSPWPTHRHSASAVTHSALSLSLSAGAVSPDPDRLRLRHVPRSSLLKEQQYPATAHPDSAHSAAGKNGYYAGGCPPLSPRGFSSAAAATGVSRFVEGSMNDRVSAAPPRGFLDPEGEWDSEDGGDGGMGVLGGMGMGLGVDKPSLRVVDSGGGADWEDEDAAGVEWGYARRSGGDGNRARGGGFATAVMGGGGVGVGTSTSRYALRRPRSTAGWVRSSAASMIAPSAAATAGAAGQQQRGGVVKKTSFLAPLWDGVREKLNLSKSKSSGSIGRVVNSVVGGAEKKIDREKEKARLMGMEEKEKATSPPPGPAYPSREEVMESYKNLVASGFFEAHAIRGGRHPLRTGGAGAKAVPEHTTIPEASPDPSRKSFSEHMAASPVGTVSGRSFADHMAAQKKPVPPPLSSPTRPPPPPPRGSSRGKLDILSSPQRGTKRGASIDLAVDAEVVTRKLVKKLRHSASRLSMELTGVRDSYYTYGTLRSRPATSCGAPGPLSPTSSIFSGISSPPSIRASMDGTRSPRYGKLTKPKDGRRRRILGLTRRRSVVRAPVAAAPKEADPDAMMLDEPEKPSAQQPEPATTTTGQAPKMHRNITPPPAAFRTQHPRSQRTGNTPNSATEMQEHEPLSVVPDPNQGIPFVPRIPREFCDAMAAMVPPAAAAVNAAVVGEAKEKEDEDAKGKLPINRDSGLGEDVENNIPVWG